jgi:AcrR family transcriptional regulator
VPLICEPPFPNAAFDNIYANVPFGKVISVNAEEPRRPGRPRSERARQAVLAAALALAAEEGPAGLNMEAIARRAGVSKETLYRWWHSKTEVVLDALAERGQRTIPLPDTGTLRTDLRAFLRATVDSADPATVRLLHALAAAAASDESVADQVRDRFLVTRRQDLGQILQRAVTRGEITADYAALAVDLIYGSLWYRLIFNIAPLDHTWADALSAAIPPSP